MPHSTTVHKATINGQEFDVALLETIHYSSLSKKEPVEIEKLLNASRMPGFFHLDLKSEPTNEILAGLQDVYVVTEKYFDEPPEEQKNDFGNGPGSGYDPGEQDRAFEIARDKVTQGTLVLPKTLGDHAELLERFSKLCHSVTKTMLSCLSDALGLDDATRFENNNLDDKPSDSALNIYYAPAKKDRHGVDTTHTDGGTLTILFGDQWGSMIEDPESKAWAFIEPKPGCALVNVGDSLQKLSGNQLHSCRHRVTQPVDGFQRRYFVVYYLRPEKTNQA